MVYSLVVKRVPHELESVVDSTKTNNTINMLLRSMAGHLVFSLKTWVRFP